MQNKALTLTRAGLQAQCTEYFDKNLDIGTYNEVLNTYFPKEEEAKQMNMQLSIAMSKAIKTQGEKLELALNNPTVRVKMFDTILRILRYGAIINSEHIYFAYFASKDEPSASFNIQYQAEKKILEKNGFTNIKEEFVLESELDGLEYISVNGVETITQKKYDFKKRATTSAKTLLNDIMFGYATYTRNGERLTIRVEKDTLKKSFAMAEKKGSNNFKWESQQAIKIAIAHSLFRFLINQDWDMEFYENEEKPATKLQPINTEIPNVEIDNIPENANEIIEAKQKEFEEKRQKEMAGINNGKLV